MTLLLISRVMLSAAHALAMDAKNLLDVIDSIRIRFPEVNDRLVSFYTQDNEIGELKSPSYVSPDTAAPHEVGYVSMNSQNSQSQAQAQAQAQLQVPVPELVPISQPQPRLHLEPQTAPVACVVSKTQIEQPIYSFATRVPPSIGPNASLAKNS